MKVAVVGSRTFTDYILLKETLDKLYPNIQLIVSGGAQGADSLAEKYAQEEGIPTLIIYPEWKKYGKAAGFVRNKDIVGAGDILVAFWDGASKGTKDSIDFAKKLDKRIILVAF